MKHSSFISGFIFAALIGGGLSFTSTAKKPVRTESQRDAQKSDYIFLEALKYKADDADDAYYSLIEAAYLLNPSDLYLSKEYGMKNLFENSNDSIVQNDTFDRFQKYLDANPNDFYEALEFVSLTNMLGDRDRTLSTIADLYEHYPERVELAGAYADMLAAKADSASISKAIGIYDDIERTEGVSPATIGRKINIYNDLKDTAAVKAQVMRLVESMPRSAEYATIAGGVFQQMGDNDSALILLDRALALDADYGPAYLQKSRVHMAAKDTAAYRNEVNSTIRKPDIDFATKLEMLYVYSLGQSELNTPDSEIESLFKTLVGQYPKEPKGHFLYGDYLTSKTNYAPAAEQIALGLEDDPSDSKRWQMLGSIYFTEKDFDGAIATVRDALKFFPAESDLYALASSAMIQKKDYPGALDILREGIAKLDSTQTDTRSELYSAIADTYYAKGDADSAFIYYNKSLELDPDNLLALNNCAYHMACTEKDLDKALTMIERVVKENPESATSLDTYAWVLFKMKNYEKAKEIIDGALANDDDGGSAEVLEHAGDIYFMSGDPEKAVMFWEQALEKNPDNDLLKRKVKNKTFFYK